MRTQAEIEEVIKLADAQAEAHQESGIVAVGDPLRWVLGRADEPPLYEEWEEEEDGS